MSDIQRDREERQHVIEVLKSWDGYFIGYTSDEVQEALRYAIASIKTDLKYDLLYEEALEEEPKIGHWIANAPQYDMFNPQYICSECGNAHTRITPYCEMCGAKMVEPQESEGKECLN